MTARPISTRRSTTTSATICCAWSSSACHPVLSTEARVALTLRLLGGLTTERDRPRLPGRPSRRSPSGSSAPSGRSPTPHVPFEVPRGRGARRRDSSSVLEVIYLIFNEGYSATAGDDWMRPALCEDALRLGRILAGLMPDEPEVHGLVALMEIQASRLRRAARAGRRAGPAARSEPRALGSAAHPARARGARARRASSAAPQGPTRLQAAIAACHARARTADETDWARIAALYDALAAAGAVAGRGAEPRGRAVDGVRARRRGSSSSTRSSAEPALQGLPPAAERPRRPAGEARPPRRGARGVRARGLAHPQRARTRAAPRPRRILPARVRGALTSAFTPCFIKCHESSEQVR